MSKLTDWQAQIAEYDAAVKEFDNLDNQDWEGIKHRYTVAKNRLEKWETIARAALKVALAAEEMVNDGTLWVPEEGTNTSFCVNCQRTAGHEPWCEAQALEAALRELDNA